MPDNFDEQDRIDLRPLKKIQELVRQEKLPRVTPEQAQEALQELGKAKKTIEELLTNTIDPETGARNATDGVQLGDIPKEEHKAWADRLVARSLELEDELDSLQSKMDARFEPVKDRMTVSKSEKGYTNTGATNKMIRQAIRRVFGQNSSTITLDMYKQALDLRSRFNKEDLSSGLEDAPLKPGENIVTAQRPGQSTE